MPVYQYQGKHYELSETDPVKAKATIIEKTGGTDTAVSTEATAPKQSLSADTAAEFAFGKGVSPDITPMGRLTRVGQAGAAGAAAGGAIGGTLGLIGGPGAPVTVPAGMLGGTVIGGIGGALGEVGEQATEAMGGGRALQALSGLVAGGLSEGTASLI